MLDTCKGSGDPARRLSRGHLQSYLLLLGKTPSGRAHTASHVVLKASSPTLVLVGFSILGTLQPEWSGSTASGSHQEGRRDSMEKEGDYKFPPTAEELWTTTDDCWGRESHFSSRV